MSGDDLLAAAERALAYMPDGEARDALVRAALAARSDDLDADYWERRYWLVVPKLQDELTALFNARSEPRAEGLREGGRRGPGLTEATQPSAAPSTTYSTGYGRSVPCVSDGLGDPATCQTHMAPWPSDSERCLAATPSAPTGSSSGTDADPALDFGLHDIAGHSCAQCRRVASRKARRAPEQPE